MQFSSAQKPIKFLDIHCLENSSKIRSDLSRLKAATFINIGDYIKNEKNVMLCYVMSCDLGEPTKHTLKIFLHKRKIQVINNST